MSVSSSRFEVFTDDEWKRIVLLLPSNEGGVGTRSVLTVGW